MSKLMYKFINAVGDAEFLNELYKAGEENFVLIGDWKMWPKGGEQHYKALLCKYAPPDKALWQANYTNAEMKTKDQILKEVGINQETT